ncbi:MAG: P-loop containing nucleoside triphosphate hydrolase protein, partial [Piptocephalis tieghemiana]
MRIPSRASSRSSSRSGSRLGRYGSGDASSGSEEWEDLEQSSSVLVAVRVRPLTSKEKAMMAPPASSASGSSIPFLSSGGSLSSGTPSGSGLRKTVEVLGDRVLVFDPPEPASISGGGGQNGSRYSAAGRIKKHKDIRYGFDRVLDETATQEQVFEGTTKGLISGVLNGFNATVFAYGATGCGKTHTISGTPEDPGVIFLTMRDLYSRIDASKSDDIVEVSLSFLEVYNEAIRDLLVGEGTRAPGPGLALREDVKKGVTVAGLSQHFPQNAEEVMRMLVVGNRNRTMSPTEANAVSSRSHAVLQVNVRRRSRTASINQDWNVATMSIIDLAGSERAAATQNRGERRREGANINRSLLALGNCINALCDQGRQGHIPYRDSKLTRLLKHSLGGNCKTVMIVCVSPAPIHYEETLNTLKYANRAKNIKTRVGRNTVSVNMHVSQYVKIIGELRREVTELKKR